MGWGFNVAIMRYGERWRANRRLSHQSFRPSAALAYRPTQLLKIHQYLRSLLQTPDEFDTLTRTWVQAHIYLHTSFLHFYTQAFRRDHHEGNVRIRNRVTQRQACKHCRERCQNAFRRFSLWGDAGQYIAYPCVPLNCPYIIHLVYYPLPRVLALVRYVPEWFPGAGFQRICRACRNLTYQMQNGPMDFVKENMASIFTIFSDSTR